MEVQVTQPSNYKPLPNQTTFLPPPSEPKQLRLFDDEQENENETDGSTD